jgi:large repetitive protein
MKHRIDLRVKYTAVMLACLLMLVTVVLGSAYAALADCTNAPNVFHGTSSASTSLTIVTASLPSGITGTRYYYAVAATGGTGSYSFSVSNGSLPDGLSLSTAGAISGTPTTASTYSFSILVTDEDLNTAVKTYSLTIYSASSPSSSTLTISPTGLSNAIVGTYYSQRLAATDGSGSYTFTVSDGSLPAGLSLSTAGVISGTPTTASTYSFTVKATDEASRTGTKTYSIAVGITSSSITMSPSSLPDGTVGTSYYRALAATGGSGSYTWTLSGGSLPDGLSLSTSGVISGTPTYSATFSANIVVTDSNSIGANRTYLISITPAASTTSTSTPSSTPTPPPSPPPVPSNSAASTSATSNTSSQSPAASSDISYSDLTIDPQSANTGSPVVVTLRVINTGSSTVSKSIALNVNGIDETQKTVDLVPGKSQVVTFNLTKSNAGTYYLKIGTLSSSLQVKDGVNSPAKESSGIPWLLIAGIVVGVIVVAVVIRILVMKSRGDL